MLVFIAINFCLRTPFLASHKLWYGVFPFVSRFLKISLFKKKKIYLFIYFWPCWVFIAARALSSCSELGLLFVAVRGLLIAVASLVAEHGL